MRLVIRSSLLAVVACGVAAGSNWQPDLPGRSVGLREAASLRGGGCVNAKDNQCGNGDRCSGTMACVKVYNGDGDGDPTGLDCVCTTCVIYAKPGTCKKS